jgi:hypothetical protein
LDSRELVLAAMEGKAPRVPVYFWLADPELEAKVGDIVGVRCWFKSFDFLEKGGPFRKGNESRREWCERLQPQEYSWPSLDTLFSEMDNIVAETLKVDGGKSFQLEILGPTEISEYSCSQGRNAQGRELGQVSHQFDFSILTILDPRKAETIHGTLSSIILEVAKRAAEYDGIDSIRIADDFCTYNGSVYRPEFTERIVNRQTELGNVIKAEGKYSVLHSDGNLGKHLSALGSVYSGLHPLDLRSKSSVADALEWAEMLGEARRLIPETVFFTGIPIDLLCNSGVSSLELVDVVRHVVENAGSDRLVLTTTHRPYPGWSFADFEEKAIAIKRLLDSEM